MSITTTIEFQNAAAKLAGRMVSLDCATRHEAAQDAAAMMAVLPKHIKNSPHVADEMTALFTLIARVNAQ